MNTTTTKPKRGKVSLPDHADYYKTEVEKANFRRNNTSNDEGGESEENRKNINNTLSDDGFLPVPNPRLDEIVDEADIIAKEAVSLIERIQFSRKRKKAMAEDDRKNQQEKLRHVAEERYLQKEVIWKELEELKENESLHRNQMKSVKAVIQDLNTQRNTLLEHLEYAKDEVAYTEKQIHENSEVFGESKFQLGQMESELEVLRKHLNEKVKLCKEMDLMLDEKEWIVDLDSKLSDELKDEQERRKRMLKLKMAEKKDDHFDAKETSQKLIGEKQDEFEREEEMKQEERSSSTSGVVVTTLSPTEQEELQSLRHQLHQKDLTIDNLTKSLKHAQAQLQAVSKVNDKATGKYAALRVKYDSVRTVLQQFRLSAEETAFYEQNGVLKELQDLRDEYRDLYIKHFKKKPPPRQEIPRFDPMKVVSNTNNNISQQHQQHRRSPERENVASPSPSSTSKRDLRQGSRRSPTPVRADDVAHNDIDDNNNLSPFFSGSRNVAASSSASQAFQKDIEEGQRQLRTMALRIVNYRTTLQHHQQALELIEQKAMFAEDSFTNGQLTDQLKLETLDAQVRHLVHHAKLQDPVAMKKRILNLQESLEDYRTLQSSLREQVNDLKEKLEEAEKNRKEEVETEDFGAFVNPAEIFEAFRASPSSSSAYCELDPYQVAQKCWYELSQRKEQELLTSQNHHNHTTDDQDTDTFSLTKTKEDHQHDPSSRRKHDQLQHELHQQQLQLDFLKTLMRSLEAVQISNSLEEATKELTSVSLASAASTMLQQMSVVPTTTTPPRRNRSLSASMVSNQVTILDNNDEDTTSEEHHHHHHQLSSAATCSSTSARTSHNHNTDRVAPPPPIVHQLADMISQSTDVLKLLASCSPQIRDLEKSLMSTNSSSAVLPVPQQTLPESRQQENDDHESPKSDEKNRQIETAENREQPSLENTENSSNHLASSLLLLSSSIRTKKQIQNAEKKLDLAHSISELASAILAEKERTKELKRLASSLHDSKSNTASKANSAILGGRKGTTTFSSTSSLSGRKPAAAEKTEEFFSASTATPPPMLPDEEVTHVEDDDDDDDQTATHEDEEEEEEEEDDNDDPDFIHQNPFKNVFVSSILAKYKNQSFEIQTQTTKEDLKDYYDSITSTVGTNTAPPPDQQDAAVLTDRPLVKNMTTNTVPPQMYSIGISTDYKQTANSFTQVIIHRRDVLLQVNRQPAKMDLAIQTKILAPTADAHVGTAPLTLLNRMMQTEQVAKSDFEQQAGEEKPEVEDADVQVCEEVAEMGCQTENNNGNGNDDKVIDVLIAHHDKTTLEDSYHDSASLPESHRHHDTPSSSRPNSATVINSGRRKKFGLHHQQQQQQLPSFIGSGRGKAASRPSSADAQILQQMMMMKNPNTTLERPSSALLLPSGRSVLLDEKKESFREDDDDDDDENNNSSNANSSPINNNNIGLLSTTTTSTVGVGSQRFLSSVVGSPKDLNDFTTIDDNAAMRGGEDDHCGMMMMNIDDTHPDQILKRKQQQQKEREDRIEQSVYLRLRLTQHALSAAEHRAGTANEKYHLLRHAISNAFQLDARQLTDHEIVSLTNELLQNKMGDLMSVLGDTNNAKNKISNKEESSSSPSALTSGILSRVRNARLSPLQQAERKSTIAKNSNMKKQQVSTVEKQETENNKKIAQEVMSLHERLRRKQLEAKLAAHQPNPLVPNRNPAANTTSTNPHQKSERSNKNRFENAKVEAEKYKSFADYVTHYQERLAAGEIDDVAMMGEDDIGYNNNKPNPDFSFMYRAMSRRLPGIESREAMTPSPNKEEVYFAGWASALRHHHHQHQNSNYNQNTNNDLSELGLRMLRKSRNVSGQK